MSVTSSSSTTRWKDVAGIDIASLKTSTRTVLWHLGVPCSANKVARIVIDYVERVLPKGVSYFEYLKTEVELTREQRRQLDVDPTLQRVIAYADPTGETAVRNVMRTRGH